MKNKIGIFVAVWSAGALGLLGCGGEAGAPRAAQAPPCAEPTENTNGASTGDYVIDLRNSFDLSTAPDVLEQAERETAARIEADRNTDRSPMPLPIPLTDEEARNIERRNGLTAQMRGVEDVLRANSDTTLWWQYAGSIDQIAVTVLVTARATDAVRSALVAAMPNDVAYTLGEVPISADERDAAIDRLNAQFAAAHREGTSGPQATKNLFSALAGAGITANTMGFASSWTHIVIGIDQPVTAQTCEALDRALDATGERKRLGPITVALRTDQAEATG